jgi:hypothetical protein
MKSYEFIKPILLEYNRATTLSNLKLKQNLVEKFYATENRFMNEWLYTDQKNYYIIDALVRSNNEGLAKIQYSKLNLIYPDNIAKIPLPENINKQIIERFSLNVDLDLFSNKILSVFENELDPDIHKYIPWVLREYIKNNIGRLEDITDVNQVLLAYDRAKKLRGFPPNAKDIIKLDFRTLRVIMRKYDPSDPEGYSQNMGSYEEMYGEIDVTTDEYGVMTAKPKSDIVVVIPKDKASSIYFGRYFGGLAEWCTAYIPPRTNRFDDYKDDGPLYIIVPREPEYENEKYQFHFKSEQFKDHNDEDITISNMRKLFSNYPILVNLFGNKFAQIGYIKYIPEELRTSEICLAAVQQDGEALEHVPDRLRTPEICLAAVKRHGLALLDVPDKLKTPELCLISIRKNSYALNYVPEELRTPEFYLSAVQQNGDALNYVPDRLRTPELCLAAVEKNGNALRYVPHELRTPELCLIAVQENGHAIQDVPKELRTPEFYLSAVQQNGDALNYVPHRLRTPELCLIAVKQNGNALNYVPYELRTPELCLIAVQQYGYAIQGVPYELRTPELYLAAVKQNGYAIQVVPKELRTPDLYLAAVQENDDALRYVPDELKDTIRKQLQNNNDVNESLSRIKELIKYI